TGIVLLAGFALPPLSRLRHVPPLRVLRRDLAPLPVRGWVVYGAALAAVTLLMWRYTQSASLTAAVLAGAIAAASILGGVGFLLLRLARRMPARVGVAWRFGVNNLWRRARASVSQILAFGLALMAMAVIALVRGDLMSTWQTQLPAATPNHFAFNILPADVAAVERFFSGHGVRAQALYPMVRGRLIAINDAPVVQAVTKEARDDGAVNRELNLTWTDTLPPDNRITQGSWWDAVAAPMAVSVEEKLATRLNIKLGDRLTFSIGGEELTATVASLRTVQWDSFHPNFYMIFPRGVLDPYPATYLTSFYLAPPQKPLLRDLVQTFPAVTVLEMERVLAQVRVIVEQVTAAVEFILLFVLAAGLVVLYAALQATLDERLYDGALMRALGASRRQLRAGHLAEFTALGLAAGILAAIGTELIAYLLYGRVFGLDYAFKWQVWLAAPLAGAAILGAAGYIGTRRVVGASPLALLRRL
ncbi:MAG: ABC transporter permease, partial [Gammaproteobacteria bacterium]